MTDRASHLTKVYLDNNVVSAIATDDTPTESDALDRLLLAYDEKKVGLVTSEVTLDEIKACRDRGISRRLEWTFRLLEKIPIVQWDQLLGINIHGNMHTWLNTPLILNDPMYDKLLTLGVKSVDAQHVFVAATNACEVFLTCDGGIFHHSPAIGKLCSLIVQKPSGFVASQGW